MGRSLKDLFSGADRDPYGEYGGGRGARDDSSWGELAPTPPKVDLTEVLTKGLDNLPPDEKDKLLAEFVKNQLKSQGVGGQGPVDELARQKSENDLAERKQFFKVKFWGTIIGGSLLLVGLVAFIGTFVYVTLKQGVLSDGSVITGIFSTVGEVFRILLSSGASRY